MKTLRHFFPTFVISFSLMVAANPLLAEEEGSDFWSELMQESLKRGEEAKNKKPKRKWITIANGTSTDLKYKHLADMASKSLDCSIEEIILHSGWSDVAEEIAPKNESLIAKCESESKSGQ